MWRLQYPRVPPFKSSHYRSLSICSLLLFVGIAFLLPFSTHIHPALPNQDFPAGQSLVGEEEAAGGSQGREEKLVLCSGPLCRAWWLQSLGFPALSLCKLCLHTQRAGTDLLEVIAEAGLATSCFVVVLVVSWWAEVFVASGAGTWLLITRICRFVPVAPRDTNVEACYVLG